MAAELLCASPFPLFLPLPLFFLSVVEVAGRVVCTDHPHKAISNTVQACPHVHVSAGQGLFVRTPSCMQCALQTMLALV